MPQRVTRDPSPLRSAALHGGLSVSLLAGLVLAAIGAIHVWGDDASATPVRQIALFEADLPEAASPAPALKARLATAEAPVARRAPPPVAEEDTPPPFYTDATAPAPDLGVEYTNGVSRVLRASAPASDEPAVRINGISVSTGQSWQERRTAKALPPAPVDAVSEITPDGRLPKTAADGRTPAGVYGRPFSNPEGRPTVSIVLGGLGINHTHTRSAIDELPAEVTLSFAPTTRDLQGWIDRARAAGHEVLLEVPMEAYETGTEQPHPQTLSASMDAASMEAGLNGILASASGYFGITNYQGGRLARDEAASAALTSLVAGRGLAFVEDGSLSRSAFSGAAGAAGLRYRQADTPIDTKPDGSDIQAKLLELETLALENGTSVGSGFAYPVTIDILKDWTDGLASKGLALAPVSAVTRAAPLAAETADTATQAGGQAPQEALDKAG